MPDHYHAAIYRTHRSDYRAWKAAQLRASVGALFAAASGCCVTIQGVEMATRDEYAAAERTAAGLVVELVEFVTVKGVG